MSCFILIYTGKLATTGRCISFLFQMIGNLLLHGRHIHLGNPCILRPGLLLVVIKSGSTSASAMLLLLQTLTLHLNSLWWTIMGKESALIWSHSVVVFIWQLLILLCSCMVDGKNSPHSKFHPTEDVTTLRFSVGALMFKDMMSQPSEKRVNTCNKLNISVHYLGMEFK